MTLFWHGFFFHRTQGAKAIVILTARGELIKDDKLQRMFAKAKKKESTEQRRLEKTLKVTVQAGGQAVRKQLCQLEGRPRTLTALLVKTFGTIPSWTLIIYCMYVVWWLKTLKSPKYVCDQTIVSDVTRGRVFNFQGLTIFIFQVSV